MRKMNLRRLTASVENPDHDGRRRYGVNALKSIDAGEVVKHWVVNDRFAGVYDQVESRSTQLSLAMSAKILQSSVPCSPQSLSELMEGWDVSDRWAMDVLQKLLDTGVIDLEKVDAACNAIHEEMEAEDEAVEPNANGAERPAP